MKRKDQSRSNNLIGEECTCLRVVIYNKKSASFSVHIRIKAVCTSRKHGLQCTALPNSYGHVPVSIRLSRHFFAFTLDNQVSCFGVNKVVHRLLVLSHQCLWTSSIHRISINKVVQTTFVTFTVLMDYQVSCFGLIKILCIGCNKVVCTLLLLSECLYTKQDFNIRQSIDFLLLSRCLQTNRIIYFWTIQISCIGVNMMVCTLLLLSQCLCINRMSIRRSSTFCDSNRFLWTNRFHIFGLIKVSYLISFMFWC